MASALLIRHRAAEKKGEEGIFAHYFPPLPKNGTVHFDVAWGEDLRRPKCTWCSHGTSGESAAAESFQP